MKFLFVLIAVSISFLGFGQNNRYQTMEFSGTVLAIEPDFNFALERMLLDVNGRKEAFRFYPNYGQWISEKIKVGDAITIKANVDLRAREKTLELQQKKGANWYFFYDRITEIKVGSEWISIDKSTEGKSERGTAKIFIDKKVINTFSSLGLQTGLIFENGIVGYNLFLHLKLHQNDDVKSGEQVSFTGFKIIGGEGYRYPVDNAKEVYRISLLKKSEGSLSSFLFKQNFTCIGVKFKTDGKKDLMLSFPSYRALEIKNFLKPDTPLRIYYSSFDTGRPLDLPELHAIIQGTDTLRIEEVGFFGGADGKHDYNDIEFKGKITKVNKSEKGNVLSLIVDSEYYVEIDALMAQQLGTFFQKGKELIVAGKERVKKIGEIYSKNYRIISPEKIAIDGKYFSLYHP